MNHIADRNALIDGHRIADGVYGAGEPVVLVHGTPSSSYIWRHIVRRLVDAGDRSHERACRDRIGTLLPMPSSGVGKRRERRARLWARRSLSRVDQDRVVAALPSPRAPRTTMMIGPAAAITAVRC